VENPTWLVIGIKAGQASRRPGSIPKKANKTHIPPTICLSL
jgi:hypothetical protein